MKAGTLRHRLIIQSPVDTLSASGDQDQTWADVGSVWGKIEPISGSEIWRMEQVNPLVSHAVTIRWFPGVTPKMRLKFINQRTNTTHYYNITSSLDVEMRGVELSLACTESVDV